MGKISLDLSSIKAAGVYTIEIDNSTRSTTTTNAIRLCVGFSNKGPFNRPVYLGQDSDRTSVFGDIDTKLEHKGCFFNRMLRTLLSNGPVLALNLLKVDENYSGPDLVNYAALSLDTATPNPAVSSGSVKYGEYDYLAETSDSAIYGTTKGDNIPYVGATPFASLYNRSRFWVPDKDLLTAVSSRGLSTGDDGSYEHTNLLNFANVGTEEFSLLVFKPENITGYNITAASWYGGEQNIPYGWIRPGDYLADYFIQVVCIKGNWTNYTILALDPVWSSYFDANGIIKSKINNFISADGITLIGSWSGIIIPDFVTKQGDNISIERRINAVTETTGLLMSFNEDAAHVLTYDYTGADTTDETEDGASVGVWGYDIDGDHEITSTDGESEGAKYIVDMVGHGLFANNNEDETATIDYQYVNIASDTTSYVYPNYGDDTSVSKQIHPVILANTFDNLTETVALVNMDTDAYVVDNTKIKCAVADASSIMGKNYGQGYYIFDDNDVSICKISSISSNSSIGIVDLSKFTKDQQTFLKTVLKTATVNDTSIYYAMNEISMPNIGGTPEHKDCVFVSGVYLPMDFLNSALISRKVKASDSNLKALITNSNNYVTYYTLGESGLVRHGTTIKPTIISHNVGNDNDAIVAGSVNNVRLGFTISNITYIIDLQVTVDVNKYITNVIVGGNTDIYSANILGNGNTLNANVLDDTIAYGATMNVIGASNDIDCDLVKVLKPVSTTNEYEYDENTVSMHFLSYNYVQEETLDTDPAKCPVLTVNNTYYFNDATIWESDMPIASDTKNMFIVTNSSDWLDKNIKVGDFVQNITYYNNMGETATYKVIPGITRVIKKQFIPVTSGKVTWKGTTYNYEGPTATASNNAVGFYLFTTTEPVLINSTAHTIVRLLPLSDDIFSHSLRFIPMKGLKLTSRHRPGYDEDGNISIESGISKIYSVLEDAGIRRGLCNPAMVDYRYIIDSMSYGLDAELGGKYYLSALALERGKCTAILNMPSAKQFAVSTNPYFCDSYIVGTSIRPSFDTKYIPEGGNTEMGASRVFSLPTEDDGAKYAAAFFPHLIYTENGKNITVPPAADVANVLYRKFTGINDTYAICANLSGILSNRYLTGLEFDADTTDREYLEPFGVNTIIRDRNQIMIYGNLTCYLTIKSDLNKLHVRENLNTMEIECYAILKQYNFLYNTATTRAAIVLMLTPVLSSMQTSGALASYEIICDETNNTDEIIESDYGIVDIAVWFNHGMEKIVQRITINRYSSSTDNTTE